MHGRRAAGSIVALCYTFPTLEENCVSKRTMVVRCCVLVAPVLLLLIALFPPTLKKHPAF